MLTRQEQDSAEDLGTRERLMAVAEKLFARDGYEAVSIRSINAAAGANPAAVHYHFGSKEALVLAILERRMDAMDQWRWARRDELAAKGEPITPRQVVELLVCPLLRLLEDDPDGGPTYVNLLARLYLGRREIVSRRGAIVGGFWRDIVRQALPSVDPEVAHFRLLLMVDSAFVALGRRFAQEDVFAHPDLDPVEMEEHLIQFLTDGLAGRES
jgi:AcrR family transcriptional regulator